MGDIIPAGMKPALPLMNYVRRDPQSGVEVLMSLFDEGWIAITIAEGDKYLTTFMPFAQFHSLTEDMTNRLVDQARKNGPKRA